MRLYEINEAMNYLKNQMEEDEVSMDMYKDTLDYMRLELDEKADNICCILKEWNATMDAMKAEKKSLDERIKAIEKKHDALYGYLEGTLKAQNIGKLETPRNKVTFRKCPPKVVISNELEFIRWAEDNLEDALKYKDPEINKTYIKDLLKSGITINNVKLVQEEKMQIK